MKLKFQLTAARRRLVELRDGMYSLMQFQLTAARRRLDKGVSSTVLREWFQLTAARRRLGYGWRIYHCRGTVSTHSRPKAAGSESWFRQPCKSFQLTAARRRLECTNLSNFKYCIVSTHSRPKAAGIAILANKFSQSVSTHSRPKAAGVCGYPNGEYRRRFNSQPPEGGWTATHKR